MAPLGGTRAATMSGCLRLCWMATTSRVAFAMAASGNHCSASRRRFSNGVPVRRWGDYSNDSTSVIWWPRIPRTRRVAGDATGTAPAGSGRATLPVLLARTGGVDNGYCPETSSHLAEKFGGKNLTSGSGLPTPHHARQSCKTSG